MVRTRQSIPPPASSSDHGVYTISEWGVPELVGNERAWSRIPQDGLTATCFMRELWMCSTGATDPTTLSGPVRLSLRWYGNDGTSSGTDRVVAVLSAQRHTGDTEAVEQGLARVGSGLSLGAPRSKSAAVKAEDEGTCRETSAASASVEDSTESDARGDTGGGVASSSDEEGGLAADQTPHDSARETATASVGKESQAEEKTAMTVISKGETLALPMCLPSLMTNLTVVDTGKSFLVKPVNAGKGHPGIYQVVKGDDGDVYRVVVSFEGVPRQRAG